MVDGGRLHRATFSRSLAQHVIERAGRGEVVRFDAVKGRTLGRGEPSASGLYAIVARRRDRMLRLAMSLEEADTLCDYDSRYIAEAWLSRTER